MHGGLCGYEYPDGLSGGIDIPSLSFPGKEITSYKVATKHALLA
jgi:hypothetical protein